MSALLDVFLSYSSDDVQWVESLRAALLAKGVTVWLDRDQIQGGTKFVRSLEDALERDVRSVVVVVSRASMASPWVREEYERALNLSLIDPGKLRLIPVVIDDTEPHGFLANRMWIDFRDPGRFDERIQELIATITGRGFLKGSDVEPVHRKPESGVSEVDVLDRHIERVRRSARNLRFLRYGAVLPGCGVAVLYGAGVAEALTPLTASVLGGAPLVTLLAGWGATQTSLTKCNLELKKLEPLRDGLELCRNRTIPHCSDLRDKFWEVLRRLTSDVVVH